MAGTADKKPKRKRKIRMKPGERAKVGDSILRTDRRCVITIEADEDTKIELDKRESPV